MSEEHIYLIDGHSQLFKAFFAVRGLTSPSGMPTNAVFGFAQIINRIIDEFAPSYMCVCFDLPGKTFRNDLYAEYKAHRPPTPEDLDIQTPHAKRFIVARGIRTAEKAGYESDDLLVTLARRAAEKGMRAFIVSSDKDLLQAVGDRISVVRMGKNQFEFIDRERVIKDYGVPPEMMTDFQGLVGDSSDNIPGVPGIGEKTAPKLLSGFSSLEELLSRLDKVANPKLREKVRANADKALLSKRLATLRNDVPLDFDVEDCRFDNKPSAQLYEFYREMGFLRLRDAAAKALGLSVSAAPPGAAPGNERTADAKAPRMPAGAGPGEDLLDVAAGEGQELTGREAEGVSPAAVSVAVQAPATKTRVVWTREEMEELARRLERAKRFAFDTETTSPDPMRARLVGISVSCEEGAAAYLPIGHKPEMADRAQLSAQEAADVLGPVFAGTAIAKVAQNAKYDLHVLERHGIHVSNLVFDPMIASYLIDPEAPHGLKAMARQWLGVEMTPIQALIGSGKSQITMAEASVAEAAAYSGADADMTLCLVAPLQKALHDNGLDRMLEAIEMPLVEVLMRMERRGITIDAAHLGRVGKEIDQRLAELAAEAVKLAGHDFNLDSPRQLARILFDELGLPAEKRGQTGLSTDVGVLEELASKHPLPKLMLDYRAQKKIKSTYIDALPKLVNPETGRIHTSFNQTVAATGRLSSSDPNLQNIPVRTPLGRRVREGFLPSKSGNRLLAADYSQIELRILAHVTREPALVEAFNRDLDIHKLTASKIFGVGGDAVSEEQRSQAKTVNFGVIYGMSAMALSKQLGIGLGRAAAFIKDYFAAYPKVREWTRAVVEEARKRGYVATLSGRRRYLPALQSKSPQIRANAERIAVNTPIQGTAADMIKVAMLRLEERLSEAGLGAEMILQVHDELIFDAPQGAIKELGELAASEMRQALPLSVPLKVDVKSGRNWAEC